MGRAKQNKLYRTFVKGLITEASYLTYPEDASIDELNTILSRKGNRTRRLGIDYEDNFELIDLNIDEDSVLNEFLWRSAAKDATVNFLCLQIGTLVHFFSLEESPISDSLKAFSIDLTDYKMETANDDDVKVNHVRFASGQGLLFIVHPLVEPLCVEYNINENSISVVKVVIQIRDFEGVNDDLANDEEPTTLSTEHHYNLLNQGWLTPGTRGASPGTGSTIPSSTYYNPYTGSSRPYEPGGHVQEQ